jgi:hypothetical protein
MSVSELLIDEYVLKSMNAVHSVLLLHR